MSSNEELIRNVNLLHRNLRSYLNEKERKQFIEFLDDYHENKNIYSLFGSLRVILDSQKKRELLDSIHNIITGNDQPIFRKLTQEWLMSLRVKKGGKRESFIGNSHQPETSVVDSSPRVPRKEVVSAPPGSLEFSPPASGSSSKHPIRRVVLMRNENQQSFGFSVRGGTDENLGIYVSMVERESPSDHAGLFIGDQILFVDGQDVSKMGHMDATQVITKWPHSTRLVMDVRSEGRVPASRNTSVKFAWMDAEGRSVSPPPEVNGADRPQQPPVNGNTELYRSAVVSVKPNQSLGLLIRGGQDYNLGIYITGVDPYSAAEDALLKVEGTLKTVESEASMPDFVPYDEIEKLHHHDEIDALHHSDNIELHQRKVLEEVHQGNDVITPEISVEEVQQSDDVITPVISVEEGHHRDDDVITPVISVEEGHHRDDDVITPVISVEEGHHGDDDVITPVISVEEGHHRDDDVITPQISLNDVVEEIVDSSEAPWVSGKRTVTIHKRAPTLGLAIEGGAGTHQHLPRIISVQPQGCAGLDNVLKPGDVILEVDGKPLSGLTHILAAKTIALAFKNKTRDSFEILCERG